MKVANTLCLAALLLAGPLAGSAVHAWVYYDEYYNTKADASGTVRSSGNKGEKPTGTWEEYVYIGHAFGYGTNVKAVESSSNEGLLGEGLTMVTAYGGYASGVQDVQANSNALVLQKGVVFVWHDYLDQIVCGGQAFTGNKGEASHNTVTFEKGVSGDYDMVQGGNVSFTYAGERSGSASDNTVTINEGFAGTINSIQAGSIGSADSETVSISASDNKLYITRPASAKIEKIEIGMANGTTDVYANGNYGELVLNENTSLCQVKSGYAKDNKGNAEASGNSLHVTGGKIAALSESLSGELYGGEAQSLAGEKTTAKASNNTLDLTDVAVDASSFVGGDADNRASGACTAEANDNAVVLRGGTYTAEIIAGRASLANADSGTAEASNNRVELRNGASGAPNLANATITVASASADNESCTVISSGNSLNFYDVKGMTAKGISGFQSLNYEYSEMHAGDTILTVSDSPTTIPNTNVKVRTVDLYGKGNSEFEPGDKVVLLKNEHGINTEGFTHDVKITAATGISLTYDDVVVHANETELVLIRPRYDDDSGEGYDWGTDDDTGKGGGSHVRVQPGTKAIAEGAASGLALVNESSNAAIDLLREFSLAARTITPFVHVQSSSMRHETGSSINVNSVSLLAGLGTGIDTGAGNLSLGAFFEYGKGSYTTHNSFDSRDDVDGDGNSWYMGGGIVAKMDFAKTGPGHFYLEGSGHMGTLHNEYDSNDLHDAKGTVAEFDMDSPYYSLHGGLGYVWNMAEDHNLDIYGKYIWTRVDETDDTLTTKDKFEHYEMDSNRVRFGVRYSYKGSERFSPYVGAAFEHEFSGSCESTTYGHPVAAPSFEGSSGMGELGLRMKPSENLPLSINLGVQGYVGQKQGVSGSCLVKYEF